MYTDFFKKIDSEEKAYWLGFIAADGTIPKELNRLVIELKISDKTHLEKFAINFDNYYKIKECLREHPSCLISVNSKQCCYDLLQYGIIPNKSLTLAVNTDLIPDEFKKDYIRGYFDGDGSIYVSTPNRSNGFNYEEWGCNFVGTYHTLSFIKDYFNLTNKIVKKGNYYSLDINGTLKTYEIMSQLYQDAKIFLDRKYEKYKILSSSQRLNKLVSKRDYFAEEKDTSVLVGLILGGGSFRNLKIVKQLKEESILNDIKKIFDKYNYKSEIRKINGQHGITYQFAVQLSPEVAKHYKHQFYPNQNKTITRHLLNELNNDGLYIWLSLNSHEVDGGLSLGTLRFTLEENEIIKKYFEVVHGLDIRLRKQRDKYYLHFTKRSKEELFDKVYVPSDTL